MGEKQDSGIWVKFVFLNFAAPIAFYIVFRHHGAKPAIVVALVFAFAQVIAHRIYREKFSPFFIVGTVFTVLFGGADLLIHDPRYFRLESFVSNFVIASVFLVTGFRKRPVIAWFAESLPASIRPNPEVITPSYARKLTRIWAAYLFTKAFIYLYLAFQVNLGNLIALRALIGGGSGLLLLLGEMFYRFRLARRVALRQVSQ